MKESLDELDGVFTYLVATSNSLGMAKDVMAAKPWCSMKAMIALPWFRGGGYFGASFPTRLTRSTPTMEKYEYGETDPSTHPGRRFTRDQAAHRTAGPAVLNRLFSRRRKRRTLPIRNLSTLTFKSERNWMPPTWSPPRFMGRSVS